MANITHYEVYAQRNNNWRLQERFPSDQRDRAFNLAKKLEKKKVPIKIIRESFDVQDNRYMESIEYVNGLSNTDANKAKAQNKTKEQVYTTLKPETKPKGNVQQNSQDITGAIITIIAIISFCLVFANLFVTLLSSVIEEFFQPEHQEMILSTLFFFLFLLTAIPLIITKVPWYVFDNTGELAEKTNERKIFSTAESIISLYRLNDDVEPSISPVADTPIEYRKYIIDFLSEVVSDLNEHVRLNDSYRKLGMRFIIFGGCLGISQHVKLTLGQANALLFECFQIMDGDDASVENFYEAKRAYKNNQIAIYLTGVGAFLVDRLLKGKTTHPNLVKKAFDRWLAQEKPRGPAPQAPFKVIPTEESFRPFDCAVNIKTQISKKDADDTSGDESIPQLNALIEDLVNQGLDKFNGTRVPSLDGVYSIKFTTLNEALGFAVAYDHELNEATEDINDDNLFIVNRCNVLSYDKLFEDNIKNLLDELFDMAYDFEIIVEKEAYELLEKSEFQFEHLGEKNLPKSNITVDIYKLVY